MLTERELQDHGGGAGENAKHELAQARLQGLGFGVKVLSLGFRVSRGTLLGLGFRHFSLSGQRGMKE